MSCVANSLKFFSLCICLAIFSAMDMRTPGSSGGVSSADLDHLKFVSLQDGQGILEAKIFDEPDAQNNNNIKSYDVKEISFGGSTKLGGVKCEDDFSAIDLDLASIREINVVNSKFESKRYKIENTPEVFVLVKVLFDTGAVVENILIPNKVQISAVEVKPNAGRAWLLANLSKIEIKKYSDAQKNAVNLVNGAFASVKAAPGHKVVKKVK